MSENDSEDNDLGLFQKEMAQVQPLKSSNTISHQTHRQSVSKNTRNGQVSPAYDIQDNFSDTVVEDCPQALSFSRSGLQHALLKNLRLGKIAIESELDLHGMTVNESRQALLYFLAECEDLGYRCAIVIHGKGYSSPNKQPVIKAHVNHWLKQAELVLAFCSAQVSDGGTGAVYVLLKKK